MINVISVFSKNEDGNLFKEICLCDRKKFDEADWEVQK